MNEVTRILNSLTAENSQSAGELLPVVYDELRRLAAHQLAGERPGQTLQPTALVHEAWLRLVGPNAPAAWNGRAHFFGVAAEAMRRILVENARRKLAQKRGGDRERVNLDEVDLAVEDPDEEVLLVHEALDQLAAQDPQAAELVKLRFFAGLGQHESAEIMGLAERSAGRLWAYARSWLFREIRRRQIEENRSPRPDGQGGRFV